MRSRELPGFYVSEVQTDNEVELGGQLLVKVGMRVWRTVSEHLTAKFLFTDYKIWEMV